jgi:hypothetical protein
MKIIAYHTCEAKGDVKEIEKNGAFKSTSSTYKSIGKKSHKLLGDGYYFFDNHKNMAHNHGHKRYNRKYYIFEAQLEIKQEEFLDLVGDRMSMEWLLNVIRRFKEEGFNVENMKLGELIELLKDLSEFPFKAIRVSDSNILLDKVKDDYKLKFFEGKDSFVNLRLVYTICLLHLDKSIVLNFKHYDYGQ